MIQFQIRRSLAACREAVADMNLVLDDLDRAWKEASKPLQKDVRDAVERIKKSSTKPPLVQQPPQAAVS